MQTHASVPCLMSDAAQAPTATTEATKTELAVTLIDGRGPRWLSRARWAAPLLATVATIAAPSPYGSTFATAAWLAFVGALTFPPRFRPKKARLALGRGSVTSAAPAS